LSPEIPETSSEAAAQPRRSQAIRKSGAFSAHRTAKP
jgi:hypothetical protein